MAVNTLSPKNSVSTEFIYNYSGQATNNPVINPVRSTTRKPYSGSQPATSSIAYDASQRLLDILPGALREEHFPNGLDLSRKALNAAAVNGKKVDDDKNSGDVLWTANRIIEVIRERLILLLEEGDIGQATIDQDGLMSAADKALLEILRNEEEQEDQREFVYSSPTPRVTHSIPHGLNSLDLDYSVLVQHWDGSWRNDMVGVEFPDLNTIEVHLSEAASVRITLKVRGREWAGAELLEA